MAVHWALPEDCAFPGAQAIERTRDATDVLRTNPRVDRRAPDGAMPQQNLDRPDVGPGLQEVGGKCVAKCMGRHALGQTSLLRSPPQRAPNRRGADRCSRFLPGNKYGPAGRVNFQYSRRSTSRRCASITYRSRPRLPLRTWISIRLLSMSLVNSEHPSEIRNPAAYVATTTARYFGGSTASSSFSTSVPLKMSGSRRGTLATGSHHLLRAPQRGLEEEPERCQMHLFILRPGFLLVDQVKEKAADLLFPQLGHRPPIMPEESLHAPPVGLHRRWAVVRQLQILSQLRVCCSGHLGLLVLRLPTTGLRSHKETPYPASAHQVCVPKSRRVARRCCHQRGVTSRNDRLPTGAKLDLLVDRTAFPRSAPL